jgi:cathepsin B
MKELMTNGPIEVAFTVYQDFMAYHGGVYSHKTGQMMGGHAVKLIGWGVTSEGTKYWTIANSWGEDWGEEGTFRILRGKNECGVESQCWTGDAAL